MGNDLALIRSAKTIVLTTCRRDGTPVPTPVSIAFANDAAYFRSYDKAWKTKRLRNNPRVEATASTLRGQPVGAPVPGRAVLLHGGQARTAAVALARRRAGDDAGNGASGKVRCPVRAHRAPAGLYLDR